MSYSIKEALNFTHSLPVVGYLPLFQDEKMEITGKIAEHSNCCGKISYSLLPPNEHAIAHQNQ